MDLTVVYDCTGANLGRFDVPPGVLLAGYVTGTNGVPWTPAQYAAHPSALRIDQAPVNTAADETADLLDVEAGAATIADIPAWVKAARINYAAGARPGQRWPAVYLEESELTPAANALTAAGVPAPVNLFLTKPMTRQAATAMLDATGGPFPFIGIQYEFHDLYDVSLVSTAWLNAVSRKPQTAPPGPMMQTGWRFCRKCQGLFWGPGESVSVCPRGAQHDGSQSHEYTLEFVK